MSDNPYRMESNDSRLPGGRLPDQLMASAKQRVQVPAILMIVSAILNSLTACMSFFYTYLFMFCQDEMLGEMDPKDLEKFRETGMSMETFFNAYGIAAAIFGVIGILVSLLIIFGAVRMMALKSWRLSMTAAILSLVPCLQTCCLVGIPVGIYALITLADTNVKLAFRQNSE